MGVGGVAGLVSVASGGYQGPDGEWMSGVPSAAVSAAAAVLSL